jgi:hypothetical protein
MEAKHKKVVNFVDKSGLTTASGPLCEFDRRATIKSLIPPQIVLLKKVQYNEVRLDAVRKLSSKVRIYYYY